MEWLIPVAIGSFILGEIAGAVVMALAFAAKHGDKIKL